MGQPTFQQYQQAQQARNPWAQENPTNADYFQMITQQNMRDGMPQDVAEANAVREMQGYMQEGINPMGPINGRESGYNSLQGASLAREMQQGAAADKARNIDAALTNEQGQSFGDWLVQQERQRQADELAQSKAMGQMYEQAILGNRMRQMRIADQPGNKPAYTGK